MNSLSQTLLVSVYFLQSERCILLLGNITFLYLFVMESMCKITEILA